MVNINPLQVQKILSGVSYPVGRQQIISHAKSEGADNMVLGLLNKIPNTNYRGWTDITQALREL